MSTTLKFTPVKELITGEEPPVEWLIPKFVPRGAVIALAGMPGAGKSFLSYTLSLGLATGTPILGFEMAPHRVLYFEQENSVSDYIQYMRWAYHGIGLGTKHLDLIEKNFCHAHLVLGTHQWVEVMQHYVLAVQPALVVIDTASPACNIQDENDNAEATRAVSAIKRMITLIQPSPAVIVLKHAKVKSDDGAYTLRGAKAWEGHVDSVIFQIRGEGKPRLDGLRNTRLEPAKSRAFGLRDQIKIRPEWTKDLKGLRLTRD